MEVRRGNPNPSPATRFDGSKPGPGRPRGSRNALSEAFLANLHADWLEHGAETLEAVRLSDPSTYLRVVASLLPKEVNTKRPLDDLSDAELTRAVELIKAAMAGDDDGTGEDTSELLDVASVPRSRRPH